MQNQHQENKTILYIAQYILYTWNISNAELRISSMKQKQTITQIKKVYVDATNENLRICVDSKQSSTPWRMFKRKRFMKMSRYQGQVSLLNGCLLLSNSNFGVLLSLHVYVTVKSYMTVNCLALRTLWCPWLSVKNISCSLCSRWQWYWQTMLSCKVVLPFCSLKWMRLC